MTFATIPRLAVVLAVATGCAFTARGRAEDRATPDPLAGSSVVSGTLPNGFSYYVLKNADPGNGLSLRLLVKAGAVQEDNEQRGAAHFVEHLAFAGTENFKRNDTDRFIRSLGRSWGPDVNAESRLDSTQYRLVVPTDSPGAVGKAFAFLRDVAGNVRFDPAEVERERGVLVAEWRVGRSVETRLEQAGLAMALAESRYAERVSPVSPSDVARTTPETLRRFYRDWYRTDTMAVVAVGPVDPKSLVKDIERTFGDLKASAWERPVPPPNVPYNKDLLVKVVTDRDLTETAVTFYSRFEGAMGGKAQLRRGMLQGLVTALMALRLPYGSSQDSTFLSAQTSFQTIAGGVQLARFTATLGGAGFEPAVRAIFAERARASRDGFSQQELWDAKRQLAGCYQRGTALVPPPRGCEIDALLHSEKLADSLTDLFLRRIPYLDRNELLAWGPELLDAITLADVDAWAHQHGETRGTMLLVSAPIGVPVPTEADLRAWAR